MGFQDTSGLTRCYDLISMLEAELRTARHLRQLLEKTVIATDGPGLMKHLCESLLDNAVETARTCADLREEVCGKPGGAGETNSGAGIRAKKRDRLSH